MNRVMSIDTPISADVMSLLHEAAERAAKGITDREAMRNACEEMDRISEQVHRRNGVLDIGVPAIRELRDR
ncbi:MAG TPA: hypothetical protein VHX68_12125 [Planctomycetaceae bacterium]|jgi:hypothetical protein|nr:hypothetical protein [Planctomycetaceae bacterium]